MKKLLLSILFLIAMSTTGHCIVTNTVNKTVLACNSVLTTFQYTFPIIDLTNATDLQVSTVDASGTQTILSTNYSVNTTTSTVTYPSSGTACTTGTSIVLLRIEPLTQGVAASYQGPGPTPPVMQMSDKLTMVSQQLQEQINRAILAPVNSNAGTGYSLPNPLANAYVGWDPTGTFLININASQNLSPTASPTFVGLTLTNLNGLLKSSGSSGITAANADVDYSVPNGVETLTNKTYDTAGAGNVFKINGTAITTTVGSGSVLLGSSAPLMGYTVQGSTTVLPTVSGVPTTNDCAKFDANHNLVDNGSTCSGGTGMVYPASAGIPITDASSWKTSLAEVDGDIIYGTGGAWAVQAAPTWNQSTTGSAAKWTTARNLAGNSVDGSGNVAFANKFIAQGTADTGLSGAQFLGALGTGLVKNTTTTGVLSIATAGTDYAAPTSGSAILSGDGSGGFSNVTVGTGLSFTGGTLSNTGSGFTTQNSLTVGSGNQRQYGQVYRNTTGKTMYVTVTWVYNGIESLQAQTDSSSSPSTVVDWASSDAYGAAYSSLHFMVLNNNYYEVTVITGSSNLSYWVEWY